MATAYACIVETSLDSTSECLVMKRLGKPDTGNPSVRFDEGSELDGHWLCLSTRRLRPTLLLPQKLVELGAGHHLVYEAEGTLLLCLQSRLNQTAHCGTIEGRGKADALDSRIRQFSYRK